MGEGRARWAASNAPLVTRRAAMSCLAAVAAGCNPPDAVQAPHK